MKKTIYSALSYFQEKCYINIYYYCIYKNTTWSTKQSLSLDHLPILTTLTTNTTFKLHQQAHLLTLTTIKQLIKYTEEITQ